MAEEKKKHEFIGRNGRKYTHAAYLFLVLHHAFELGDHSDILQPEDCWLVHDPEKAAWNKHIAKLEEQCS